MAVKTNYKATITACFTGYITQSIVVNFLPLLFLTFCNGYGISLEKIAVLITANFMLQLCTDLVSTKLIDKIGYRAGMLAANVFAASGLVLLAFLPEIIDSYLALVISVALCAIGSGLEEVLISPIVEACPTKNKSAIMSLTHSFYSWGTVLVIGLSTAYFALFGLAEWRWLALFWAIVPVFNTACFAVVPIYNEKFTAEKGGGVLSLLRSGKFWFFALLMTCAGASEIAMSQWASAFAESALGVDKAVGDIAGACLFALMMAVSRTLYATVSEKIKLKKFMTICSALCVLSYALAVFAPFPWISLLACGLCGFSVGIMWPGTISMASKKLVGSTALFALLAVFGDVGASIGPSIVGFVSGAFDNDIKKGLASVIIFPVIMLIGVLISSRKKVKVKKQENSDK